MGANYIQIQDMSSSGLLGLRLGSCIMYAVMALILLYWDKTDKLGIMLGVLMMGMVSLFLIVVACMDIDWVK